MITLLADFAKLVAEATQHSVAQYGLVIAKQVDEGERLELLAAD